MKKEVSLHLILSMTRSVQTDTNLDYPNPFTDQ